MTDTVITPTQPPPGPRTRHAVRRPCPTRTPHSPSCAPCCPARSTGPDDPAWGGARLGWVVNVAQQPAAVVAVRDVEDVVAAVTCAARHGLSVSAQPVGHGATEALTGTVLLRTGALQEIEIDVERRVARVGAGVKWGALLAAVEPTGLIAPGRQQPRPERRGLHPGRRPQLVQPVASAPRPSTSRPSRSSTPPAHPAG